MSFNRVLIIKKIIILFTLSITLFLSAYTPTLAQETQDNGYGISSYLFESVDLDPSVEQYTDINSPVFREFIDNSRVYQTTLTHKPTIISGATEMKKLNGEIARGIINFGINQYVPNLALKNNVLEENEISPNIYMNTSIAGRQGNPFHALCEYKGLSQKECAEKYNLNLASGDLNPNQAVTSLQRLLPPEEYYKYLQSIAQEHLDCLSGNASDTNCSAEYYLDKNKQTSSKDVAKTITNTDYENYKNLSSDEKQQIYALNTSHALIPIIIHIDRNLQSPNPFTLLFSLLGELLGKEIKYPIYGMGWLPKTYASKVQTEYSLLSGLPPKEGQTHLENKEKTNSDPIEWGKIFTVKQAIEKKVSEQNHGSLETQKVFQYVGGYAETKPSPPPKNEIWFTINDLTDAESLKSKELYTYKISFIVPQEIAELEMDMNQIASTLIPPEYLDFPESNIQFPLREDVNPITAQACVKYDDNGVCEELGPQVEWNENVEIEGYSPEGTTNNWIFAGTQGLLPFNEPSRSQTTCWAQEYFQNNPAAQKMVEAEDVFNVFNTSSCPEQLKETTSSSINMDYVNLFVNTADTNTLTNNLLAANWKSSYQAVVFNFCDNSTTYSATCKQHLFENSCNGQLCYQYIINAAENAECKQPGPNKDKYLNPYWAIAIALNENGGLTSDKPDGSQKDHFGCDQSGAAGYNTDIPSKTLCMTNTLLGRCGMSDKENLKIYGYTKFYSKNTRSGHYLVLYGSTQ